MQEDRIALFHTLTEVFKTEKYFKGKGFEVKIIPVPRHLSSDCGVALVVRRISESFMKDLMDEAKLRYAGIFKFTDDDVL